ncbi:MAG: hypothetical protein K6F54_04535 [Lachnospiraceae bacterium]|nr:hypothetical protein [Lachnospiraceae bacterium]
MISYSQFDKYIQRLIRIRTLSTPSIEGIRDADEYSRLLRANFTQVGQLATENRAFLEETLFPLILKDEVMNDEETGEVSRFLDQLLNPVWAENLDLPIAYIVSDKLLRDALTRNDVLSKLRCMDLKIAVCYAMMNMTARVHEYPEIFLKYQKEGLDLGELKRRT